MRLNIGAPFVAFVAGSLWCGPHCIFGKCCPYSLWSLLFFSFLPLNFCFPVSKQHHKQLNCALSDWEEARCIKNNETLLVTTYFEHATVSLAHNVRVVPSLLQRRTRWMRWKPIRWLWIRSLDCSPTRMWQSVACRHNSCAVTSQIFG